MKEFLSQHEVEFTLIEISESMANLRTFLDYRDKNPAFEEIRRSGRIGLPCTVINDGEKIIFGMPDLADLK